jgi:alkylation response protein AidB-like acyl-CoA dehydrogenase
VTEQRSLVLGRTPVEHSDTDHIEKVARQVVDEYNPRQTPQREFLGACFDAGLSWVHFPLGLGGLGVRRGLQSRADAVLQDAGGPVPFALNPIGYGMAAATVVEHGPPELARELLRPLATAEHMWCQLFSEPGAGTDLAGLATSAVRVGDEWVVNGQKVWTSFADQARYGLLLARSDPDQPKHKGLTCFVLDMLGQGVEVRPLRQLTGHAEFNEVYLSGARIPDTYRLGREGDGWRVALTTLMNERSAIGAGSSRRGAGAIADAVELWARLPERHTPVLRDRLAALWTRAEAQRLTSKRAAQAAMTGSPGPEGSVGKLVAAELNQAIYEWCIEFLGHVGILYGSYEMRRLERAGDYRGPVQQRFLRARANSIEGGTSEVLRNVLAERVLGLPSDLRADAGKPWKEIPHG